MDSPSAMPSPPGRGKAREAMPRSSKECRLYQRKHYFVVSTDPRVTTNETWRFCMQFREHLLTNPRRDSGHGGWWHEWFIDLNEHLRYDGFYRRDREPAVMTVHEHRCRGGPVGPLESDSAVCERDDFLFLPGSYEGTDPHHWINWKKPFVPLSHRGTLVRWIEAWIDVVVHKLCTGDFIQYWHEVLEKPSRPPIAPSGRFDDKDEAMGPALTASQSRVLQAMGRFDGSQLLSARMLAKETEDGQAKPPLAALSEETVRQCVKKLIAEGLAERPQGDRSGARLTSAGRKKVGKIAE